MVMRLYQKSMNPALNEIQNLKRKFSLNQKEAQQYHKIIQHRLNKELSAVKKLNLLKGKLILECGTGQGRFTQALVKNLLRPNQTLYSIDSTPQMIINIRSKIKRKNFHPRVADLWKIPFPDSHFDVLVSHYTLHGLRSKSEDFLKPYKEMIRVLKPEAPLIAMTFYYDKKENSSAYFYHRLIQLSYQDKGICFFGLKSPRIYKNFLMKAGLTNIQSQRINFDSLKYPEELKEKIQLSRSKEEKSLINKIKSPKLRKEAQKVLRSSEDISESKSIKIGPTLLLWGKK
jgi:ubiquinone/menaquinone biosynthesis C-methylase UbiE